LIDAITSYEEAIKLAPDVPSFKEAYDEFLLRHGMK
jgi:cytochrome c-type biogenesis protein CcmH/NrfG